MASSDAEPDILPLSGSAGVRPRRLPVWAVAACCLLVAGGLLVLAMIAGGGVAPSTSALPSAGTATEWGLPAATLVATISLVLGSGFAVVSLLTFPASFQVLPIAGRGLMMAAAAAGAVAVPAILVRLLFTASELLAVPVSQLSQGVLAQAVWDTKPGRVLLLQAALALAAALSAWFSHTNTGCGVALILLLAALTLPPMTGHASSSDEHFLAVSSLALHVLAAALWAGGLVGVAYLARLAPEDVLCTVRRYSTLALCCAMAVGASGLINAALLMDSPSALVSGYGLLVMGKAAAFALLVGCGWLHRRHILRGITSPARSFRRGPFLRLAAGELLIMGAAYGLAVALARTPPPSTPSAAAGSPPPAAPDFAALFGTVHPDLLGLLAGLLPAACYLAGVRILKRRGDSWPTTRTLSFLAGAVAVLAVTSTGLGRFAADLFSLHMVQHMTLNMVAPLFLVLGAPITLALRTLPPGSRRGLLAVVHSLPARIIGHPVTATAIFVFSLYGLYFTPLFEAAMGSHWGHLAMQMHFLLSGFLFFWLILGIDPDPHRPGQLQRIPWLLLVVLTHTVFSVVLVFGSHPIGENYFRNRALPWHVDLLADQALGGAISWLIGEVLVVCVLAALILQWFGAADRADRAAARSRSFRQRRSQLP